MELEIVKKLGFDANIQDEMFDIYNEEITKYSETQRDSLLESLEEYRLNKRKIREYRQMIQNQRSKQSSNQSSNEVRSSNDF